MDTSPGPVPQTGFEGSSRLRGALAIGLAIIFALVLVGVIFALHTPQGTLVVEVSEPDSTVAVLNEQGGIVVQLQRATAEKIEIGVAPG